MNLYKAEPWLRRLVAGLSPRRPELDLRSVDVRSVVLPCQYHSPNAPYSSSSTRYPYQKDKREKPGNFPKKIVLFRKSGSTG